MPILEPMQTYPGTDMLVRICYDADCGKEITELSDLWVDIDSNCCVCTDCRDKAADYYRTTDEWKMSIVSARIYAGGHEPLVNEIEEG